MLAVLMLIPGALTGAGSVTVLIVGGMVATVLGYMGIREAQGRGDRLRHRRIERRRAAGQPVGHAHGGRRQHALCRFFPAAPDPLPPAGRR